MTNKGKNFIVQSMYSQLLYLRDKARILKISRDTSGEKYIKHYYAWQHPVIVLYDVIKSVNNLREIISSNNSSRIYP